MGSLADTRQHGPSFDYRRHGERGLVLCTGIRYACHMKDFKVKDRVSFQWTTGSGEETRYGTVKRTDENTIHVFCDAWASVIQVRPDLLTLVSSSSETLRVPGRHRAPGFFIELGYGSRGHTPKHRA